MLESRTWRFSRWAAAAFIVFGAHAGGAALSLMQWPEEAEPDDSGSAIVLELVPIAAVAPVDTQEIAPGPLMEEAAPAMQSSEKVKQEVPEEIPEVEPSPEPEPEVALPKPEPEVQEKEEPKEEVTEEVTPEQESPQQANPVPLTTAPPRVEAEPTPKPAAPSQGRSANEARAQVTWQKTLVKHLNRHRQYPNAARRRGIQGTVVVALKLDHSGQVVSSRVAKSSGSSLLDEEALEVLKRANPVPAPPSHLEGLELSMPIKFEIIP